jgi:hypothetical protein
VVALLVREQSAVLISGERKSVEGVQAEQKWERAVAEFGLDQVLVLEVEMTAQLSIVVLPEHWQSE